MKTGFIFLLIVCFTLVLHAQEIKSFSKEDGLAEGEIHAMYENEGKLWYGIENKSIVFNYQSSPFTLGYFDGYDFYNFPLGSIGDIAVLTEILPFGKDKLVITFNYPFRVLLFDIKTTDVKCLTCDGVELDHSNVQVENNFILYPEAQQSGIPVMKKYDGQETKLFEFDRKFVYLTFGYLHDRFIVGRSPCGVYAYSKNGELIKEYSSAEIERSHRIDSTFESTKDCYSFLWIQKDGNGDMIFLFQKQNPSNYKYNLIEDKFVPYHKYGNDKYGFEVIPDKNGNTLFKYYDNDINESLYAYGELDGNEAKWLDNFESPVVVSNNFSKYAWVGSKDKLYLIRFEDSYVDRYFKDKSMRGIIPLNDSLLLIGANDIFGWSTLNRQNGSINYLYNSNNFQSRIFPSFGFYQEDDLTIWSTYLNSIVRVSLPNEITERYNYSTGEYLNASCYTDSSIYIGITSRLKKFDKQTKTVTELVYDDRFDHINFTFIYKNQYLIICTNGGLYYLNINNNELITLVENRIFVSGIADDDHFWVSDDKGLIYNYNLENAAIKLTDEINIGSIVFSFAKDHLSRYWLGTADGVLFQDKKGKWNLNVIPPSMLSHTEANRYSIFFDSIYHKMYLGTVRGLNAIDLDKIKQSNDFNIAVSSLSYYKNDSLSQFVGDFERDTKINIPATKRYLQVKLHNADDIFSKNIRFEYKMGSQEWASQNNSNTLTFANLSSGNNELRIKAISESGLEATNELVLEINVGKYFYETWWFILSIISMTGFIGFQWYRRIKNENIRLEAEVKDRTKELRKDKEIIEKQAEELTRIDRMKNQFFSNISHELRTPLTLIKSPIEQLNKIENLSDEAKYYLSLIKDNGELLDERVSELLELSRLDSGKVKLARNHVNLHNTLDKAVRVFESRAKAINLSYYINNSTPDLMVIMDRKRVVKIIQNIINNSIKFTPEGGEVQVALKYENDLLTIVFKDTGIGIPKDYLHRIFERFYQMPVENTMANPGTGLGLAMVSDYLNLMGGQINVESQVDQGTTFSITIPISKSQEQVEFRPDMVIGTNEELVITPILKEDQQEKEKPNILLAEDNHQLRNYIATLLSKKYNIIAVEDGEKALETLYSGKKIDIILSDIMMPKKDGVSLLKEVRGDNRFKVLPFMFLTAKSNEQFKIDMYRIGVDDYLTKPFSESELLARLNSIYTNYLIRLESTHTELENDTESDVSLSDFEEEIQEIILNNLTHPQFGTDFLGEKLGMSRRNLQRIIKKEVGLTPKEYVREIQLNKVRTLLESKKYTTITAIANMVGFTNPGYLNQIYETRFGTKINFA